MGYACPVCDDQQPDEAHLANHVAFSAIIDGGEHDAWLDEHATNWGDMGPDELGPLVAEHADTVEMDEVEADDGLGGTPAVQQPTDRDDLSATDREVLAEARELTRKMYEDSESE